MKEKIVFVWENFGPMHVDRCEAVAKNSSHEVIGVEFTSNSNTYDWNQDDSNFFKKITLFKNKQSQGIKLFIKLFYLRMKLGKSVWFLCHYELLGVYLFSCFLRILGDKVFTMGCSKFDDWERHSLKEAFKRFYFLPYHGAIGSGVRSRDYFRFHGISKDRIAVEYNTLSIQRIREMSGYESAPNGALYAERHFTIVARLVPKKNLKMALHAYAQYKKTNPYPRLLYICGSGSLENELKECAKSLNISEQVVFLGFVQTNEIAQILGTSLALILPSIEEQFGNVVIEAQAMGLPVLISDVCGARDRLVRTAVNGFVFEPDNPEGLAWFMNLISTDQKLWQKMCNAAIETSKKGDVSMFADGVKKLIEH